MFSSFKAKLYAGAMLAFAVLLGVVKHLAKKNSRLERQLDTAEANTRKAVTVIQEDLRIEKEYQENRDNIADSELVEDPNSVWSNKPDD